MLKQSALLPVVFWVTTLFTITFSDSVIAAELRVDQIVGKKTHTFSRGVNARSRL